MNKIESLTIHSFRGIRGLSLEQLGDFNLIVGNNNVGKTSVLEAILLLQDPQNVEIMMRNSRKRMPIRYAGDTFTVFDTFVQMFPLGQKLKSEDISQKSIELDVWDKNGQQTLSISGELQKRLYSVEEMKGRQRLSKASNSDENIEPFQEILAFQGQIFYKQSSVNGERVGEERIDFEVDGYHSYRMPLRSENNIVYLSPVAHVTSRDISQSIIGGHKRDILKLLKLFDADIQDYDLVRTENGYMPSEMITHKKLGVVPLYTFGDGLKKMLSLASNLINARNGVLLIDEIETSMHTSVLPEIFSWLLQAAQKYHVQIFATTHSAEAVSVLAKRARELDAELVAYRIEKYNDAFYSKRYSEETLDELVNGSGIDVRG